MLQEIQTKKCGKCKQVKAVTDFYPHGRHIHWICKKCKSEENRLRIYGLSEEQYQAMFVAQEGKCAICEKPFSSVPFVDHDHSTDIVRGLLCRNCNSLLGLGGDSCDTLSRAVEYLRASKNFPRMLVSMKVTKYVPIEKNSTEPFDEILLKEIKDGTHNVESRSLS